MPACGYESTAPQSGLRTKRTQLNANIRILADAPIISRAAGSAAEIVYTSTQRTESRAFVVDTDAALPNDRSVDNFAHQYLWCGDQLHLTRAGSEVLATTVLAGLRDALEKSHVMSTSDAIVAMQRMYSDAEMLVNSMVRK